ncbi:MAG: 16S rRNA (uracil(1498)-N(3))-methyltransferase [Kiritimatiellae bacterium]|nr:16S rRNA (uracil(1498)-N(3))-methyltransferase [Kiritimatiellia bacterium]
MNRILLEAGEIREDGTAVLSGERADHILRVLHGRPGQVLKTGTVDGLAGTSVVLSIEGGSVALRPSHTEEPPEPWLDLILAVPRPKVLKRLWAPLASLGVRRVFLLNAAKVEKFYFSSQWLDPASFRPLLLEGLQQTGLTRLPKVEICPLFKPFVEDRLDGLFPVAPRLLAHPLPSVRTPAGLSGTCVVTLAVGPEGGWTEYEREAFLARGFQPFSLGRRILRTDTACIALAAVLDWLRRPVADGV